MFSADRLGSAARLVRRIRSTSREPLFSASGSVVVGVGIVDPSGYRLDTRLNGVRFSG